MRCGFNGSLQSRLLAIVADIPNPTRPPVNSALDPLAGIANTAVDGS